MIWLVGFVSAGKVHVFYPATDNQIHVFTSNDGSSSWQHSEL